VSHSVNAKTGKVPRTGVYSVEKGMTIIPASRVKKVPRVQRVKKVRKVKRIGRSRSR
jgi:hypothetical protein